MEKKIIHFETLGCRLNQDESEGAARSFAQNGFISDLESATASTGRNLNVILCIVNTCTVTGKAEQKARRIIRLLLDKFPKSIVLVTGCYAEVDGESIESINPERIVILKGTKKYILSSISTQMAFDRSLFCQDGYLSVSAMRNFIENCSAGENPIPINLRLPVFMGQEQSVGKLNLFSLYTPVFEKHSRGSIKVQDGCNCACSFCRIHFARGKSVSLDAVEVVRRVKEIEDAGVNEVVFTGVNLSQYSSLDSFGRSVNFSRLLSMVLESTKNISLRISSFYPQSVDEEICQVLANQRVQPFFHLSIQSGSDRILELMRRPHSVDHVVKSIERIRNAKENPFISCDLIAGFPGESESDFEMTQKLCEDQKFAWIHAFPFSPRPGTPAMTMKNQIPERIKGERVKWLTKKAVEGKIDYVNYWKNRTVSAIVENSRSLRNMSADNLIHAVTENYLHIECPVPDSKMYNPGAKIQVQIENPCTESINAGKEIDCTGIVIA